MNKKKSLRIMVLALVVVMIFTVCSTTFAAGERISHQGWSTLTYCSTQTVQQKNDTKFYCESASKTAGSDMLAVVWADRYRDSAVLGQISGYQQIIQVPFRKHSMFSIVQSTLGTNETATQR